MNPQPLVIETVPIGKLAPWAGNPRTEHAVDAIAKSIEAAGYLAPIVVQKGTYRILAGHGRLEALKKLGATEIPVVVADVDDDKATLYTMADNKLSELAEWDFTKLADGLLALDQKGIDLQISGFTEAEIAKIMEYSGAVEDADPEIDLPMAAVSQSGDVWECGDHRIVCGNSAEPGVIASAMKGFGAAQVVFTDPPYGVDYEGAQGKIKGDETAGASLSKLLIAVFVQSIERTAPAAAWYIWHASATRDDFLDAMKRAGLQESQYLIWAKPSFVLGHADYHWGHEPCFYAHRAGERPEYFGDRAQSTVWRVAPRGGGVGPQAATLGPGLIVGDEENRRILISKAPTKGRKLRVFRISKDRPLEIRDQAGTSDVWEVARAEGSKHPTQKPSELAEIALVNSSKAGDTVLDPFLGGGCTVLGAERTGRRAVGIDMDPRWVDVSVMRWEILTGRKARNATRQAVVMA